MNDSLKDEKPLGLPPMELAEGSTYSNRENSANIAQKCFHPWIKTVIGTIILTVIAVGTYVVILRILQSTDISRSSEIIIVTGLRDSQNITVEKQNMGLFLQIRNKTLHHARRKRRSLNKNYISNTFKLHEDVIEKASKVIPNHDESNDISNTFKLHEDVIEKARKVILSHDEPCTPETRNAVCKDIVTKLDTVNQKRSATDTQTNVKSNEKVQLHLRGLHDERDVTRSRISKDRESVFPEVLEDQLLQRHAHPESHHNEGIHDDYSNGPYDSMPTLPVQQAYPIQTPPIDETCLLARLLKQNPQQLHGVYDVPVSYLPPQPALVPYPSIRPQEYPSSFHSHYPQTRLNTPDFQERRLHPQDVDIFMRFHTSERPTASIKEPHASTREAECADGSISCDDGDSCIAQNQWCDGVVDCADASDEARCTCKSRVDKARLCDGYYDCPFGEDEMGCFGCSVDTYSCDDLDLNSRSNCFTREQRCDNSINCLGTHKDELECNLLAPSLHDKPMFAVSNTEGFLQRNFRGTWFPVCNNPYMWAHDACRRETGLIIRPPYIQMLPIDPTLRVTYLNTGPGGVMQMSDTCVNSSAVYVTCPDLLCGTRVPTTSQFSRENAAFENHMFGRNKRFLLKRQPTSTFPLYYERLTKRHTNTTDERMEKLKSEMYSYLRGKRAETRVVGGRPSQPAAWPWMVALYRNGMFHCGGVVITQKWIVSAAHCVQKFWEHYYEIQVGMLRRFSFSPQESNHRVTHVIVNQNYNRFDMKNDLSLLRVMPAIQFSRWVRPICLPGPSTAGPDWMWGPSEGTTCVAVGWGATVEHGPDPDHMREVEVPIWSQCKHREDRAGKEICAGPVEGGKDACQGDSGGPLLCRNPLNAQQWYMAGIVSHGDGCARKGEPGVYTRISIFTKWIKFHIFSKTLPGIQPKQECPGFKCISGVHKCLPKKRMCDKIIDCLDGEDEMNCNFMRSAHEEEGNLFEKVEQNELNIERLKSKEAGTESSVTKNETITFTTESTHNSETHIMNLLKNKSATVKSPIVHVNKENDVDRDEKGAQSEEKKSTTSNRISSRDNSEENITDDPFQEREENGRGDLQMITITKSNEILESKSLVSKEIELKQSKETDITENWDDTQTTTSRSKDKIIIAANDTKNILDIQTTTTAEVLTTDDKQTVETTKATVETTTTTEKSTKLIAETTTVSNEMISQIEKETKEFSINLPLEDLDKPQTSNNTDVSSKTFLESEGKHIVEKVKDIISSNLLPAKIKKEQHYPRDFECRRIYQIIPYELHCNHKADCEDGTDELGCTCIDYLTTFDRNLLCDGTVDCADGQDEIHCYGCSEDQFLCKWSQTCLSLKHVCDGTPQCPQGEDELDCFALSNGKNIEIDFDGRPKINLEGYLTRKHENSWNIVCEDNLTLEQQEEAASHICRYLGFSSANRFHVKYISLKDEHNTKTNNLDHRRKRDAVTVPITFTYRITDEDPDQARHIVIKDPQIIREQCVPNITKTCTSLYVSCERTLFTDFSEFDFDQNVLFARSEGKPDTRKWPWIAQVFVEGDYKCTGVLVDLSWVLISDSCLSELLLIESYVSVLLGSQRALRASNGPYAQVYQVDGKKELYHSKVTLLHLQQPAHYSSMVKPMEVPPFQAHSNENLPICVAIGQDDKHKAIEVFLTETEENCNRQNRCFQRHIAAPICEEGMTSKRPWTGIISCHGIDGWFPVASFVENNGECGIGKHITGFGITNLRNDMKQYVGKPLTESTEQSSSDSCDGTRCGRGRCVKLSQLCDGVTDCEDGTDEAEGVCEKKLRVCGDDPHHRGCECSSSQLKCRNGRCVSKERFGDGKDDCGDGSDEPGHVTCAQYLARVMPLRLCDGILHCHDKTDEDPLFCKCFSKKPYKCGASEHCVSPDMVCDGTPDCPHNEDEDTCLALSAPDGTVYGTGEVIARSHGVWHSKCYSKLNHTRSELEKICRDLGFISGHAKQLKMPEKSTLRLKVVLEPFQEIFLNNNTSIKLRNSDAPLARSEKHEDVENCFPVYIECL